MLRTVLCGDRSRYETVKVIGGLIEIKPLPACMPCRRSDKKVAGFLPTENEKFGWDQQRDGALPGAFKVLSVNTNRRHPHLGTLTARNSRAARASQPVDLRYHLRRVR